MRLRRKREKCRYQGERRCWLWLRWWRRWRREEKWVSWERSSFDGRRGVGEDFDIVGGVSFSFVAVAGLWSLNLGFDDDPVRNARLESFSSWEMEARRVAAVILQSSFPRLLALSKRFPF